MTMNEQSTAWRPTRILIATDLSPISDRALNYAAALARHFDAHVSLTHVLAKTDDYASLGERTDPKRETREDAEQKISRILKSEQMQGVRHTVLLEEGFLWETLDMLIRKHEIDLAIVGTHGRREVKEEFLGSWAELVFRHAECPVMTVGPACEGGSSHEVQFTHILFATDFGRASERAVPYACSLAWEYRAALTLLHVVEDRGTYSESEWPMQQEITTIRLLESLPPGMDQQCTLEFLVHRGDSAREILNVARSKRVDLIVMGARFGRSLVAHVPEPAAYAVAAEAPCPVLTVKSY